MRIFNALALTLFVTSWANAQPANIQNLVASAVDELKANQPNRESLGVQSRGDLLGFRLGMNLGEFEEHLNEVVSEQIIQEIKGYDDGMYFILATPTETSQTLEQRYELEFCSGFVCNISAGYSDWGALTQHVRLRFVDKYGPFVTTDDVFSTIEANIQEYVRSNNVLQSWERLYEREVAEANRRMALADQGTTTERQYQEIDRLQQYVQELTMEYEAIVDRFTEYQITIDTPYMLYNTLDLEGRFPMRMECEELLGPALSYSFCSPNHDRIVWNNEREGIAENWEFAEIIVIDASGRSPEYLSLSLNTYTLHSKAVSEAINALVTEEVQKARAKVIQDITI